MAEELRAELPSGFREEVDRFAADLAQGRGLTDRRAKGRRSQTNAAVTAAIVRELSLLLCSDDARYASVRSDGQKLSRDGVRFVAGVIVGALGLTAGAATACVALVAMACLKVGVGVFCRLNPLDVQTTQTPRVSAKTPDRSRARAVLSGAGRAPEPKP
jgi:hypothetical protein